MDFGSTEDVVDQNRNYGTRECNELYAMEGVSESVLQLTLHPSLPFIRLFTVQEAHILVPLHRRQTSNDQPAKHQDRKSPRVVRFLFLEEDGRTVRDKHVRDGDTECGECEGDRRWGQYCGVSGSEG